jgi:hypothetical protein
MFGKSYFIYKSLALVLVAVLVMATPGSLPVPPSFLLAVKISILGCTGWMAKHTGWNPSSVGGVS